MSERPDDGEKITEFCDYLVDYYIAHDSKFPPSVWADESYSIFRTTNACESFHAEFNKNFYFHHLSICSFIEVLKLSQVSTYIKIRSANQKIKVRKNKRAIMTRDLIEVNREQLRNEEISRLQFLKNVSLRCLPVLRK